MTPVAVIGSVCARSAAEMVQQARLAAMAGATWIELRLDHLAVPADKQPAAKQPAAKKTDPQALLAQIQLPVLVSCRTREDGGGFAGTLKERRDLLTAWVAAGARGLDLEDWEEWQPEWAPDLDLYVRSHHNRTGVTNDLLAVRDQLLGQGAQVAKLVVTAHDLADAGPVLDLLGGTDQEAQPTVAFAMGETAWPTRVLACLLGARLAFGSPGPGLGTAPGQPTVEALTGVYDVRRLNRNTALYGVVGNPARYSLGPLLFNRAFRLLDHDGIYLPLETSRPDALLSMLPRNRLRAVSVTAPYKGVLAGLCHQFDELAELAGAVNTITWQAHGGVMGHNTDIAGVREALLRAGLEEGEGVAAVLGGGGAARAAAVALEQMGLQVTLLARSLDTVRDFCRRHGHQLARFDAGVLTELKPRVVVNATPVGGTVGGSGGGAVGDAGEERVLPDWVVPEGTYVLDMVYRPRWTRLLKDARAQGGIPVLGIEMFLTQASRQLQLFVGRHVREPVLRSFVAGA